MRFQIRPHSVLKGRSLVEVLGDDDRLLATISPYSAEDDGGDPQLIGVHVVSKYIIEHRQTAKPPLPPGVLVVMRDESRSRRS